ncbi:MAG: hypothetical protein KAG92_02065 [Deltaproteobacteria bacterium]|nr:hypothetical protein [Deltaproteobacteria bacterium]
MPDDLIFSKPWDRLVQFETLKADAVFSWKATGGEHGKYKVRLFLQPPEKLKIQWLTPWGSVAGQVLIAEQQFWLSDVSRKETWHGMATDIEKLLQERGERFQIVATQFLKFWPLLFSSPENDAKNSSSGLFIEYFSAGTGENLSLTKTVLSLAGDEMHLKLSELEKLSDERLMPLAVEVLSRGGEIGIKLRKYSLPQVLPAGTFVYNLKNFQYRPVRSLHQ